VAFLCATVVFVALPYVAPGDALCVLVRFGVCGVSVPLALCWCLWLCAPWRYAGVCAPPPGVMRPGVCGVSAFPLSWCLCFCPMRCLWLCALPLVLRYNGAAICVVFLCLHGALWGDLCQRGCVASRHCLQNGSPRAVFLSLRLPCWHKVRVRGVREPVPQWRHLRL
jgi:hypothetical protein